uniref:BTB domain-containing protein n=1 Tax=Panagrellus redivivus TaxID=6233 RepID=A0A7E4WA47_PANRE
MFTHTVRLELDQTFLDKETIMNTPVFKFNGIEDFECWISVKRSLLAGITLSLEFNVLNESMPDQDILRYHLTLVTVAKTEGGKELVMYSNAVKARDLAPHCYINGKITLVSTATYTRLCVVNNDVKMYAIQLLPHEVMQFGDQNCDMKFVIGNGSISAHKAFMSLISPVFAAMFTHNTKEAQTGVINITDFDCSTVKAVIDLLYSRLFKPKSYKEVMEVLRFAEKYIINAAVDRLEKWLTHNVTPENFNAIVEYAWNHSSDKLKDVCARYYQQHVDFEFRQIDPVILGEMVKLIK